MLILKDVQNYTKTTAAQNGNGKLDESPAQTKTRENESTPPLRTDKGLSFPQMPVRADKGTSPQKTAVREDKGLPPQQAVKANEQEAPTQQTEKERIAELLYKWMEESARTAVKGTAPFYQSPDKKRRGTYNELDYLLSSLPQYNMNDCVRREMDAYKKQLEYCTSKQAVQQKRSDKLLGFVQEAYNSIKGSLNVGERMEAQSGISMRMAAAEQEYASFTSRLKYKKLPDFPPKLGQKVRPKESVWVSELRLRLDRMRKEDAEKRQKQRRLERRA